MRYTCEAVLERDADGWTGRFPLLGESCTSGRTRAECIDELADLLKLLVADYLEAVEMPPNSEHVAECVTLSVELTPEDVDEMKYVTQAEAAEWLDVGRSRISALISSGKLEARWFEGQRKVSLESLERYAKTGRKAGRPPRQMAAAG